MQRPGSSPLARGTRTDGFGIERPDGLIPARAGNTVHIVPTDRETRAHPRSRGEHRWVPPSSRSQAGSSPLARGTPDEPFDCLPRRGLIPARAGNTGWGRSKRFLTRAHPRSRGEHSDSTSASARVMGSSPLARGTPNTPVSPSKPSGLIPARAGNTRRPEKELPYRWAHPRSRGEHNTRSRW